MSDIDLDAILTKYEADFVRAVFASPGGKRPYDGPSPEGRSVWQKPEELGLVECVGSWKWVPGKNLVVKYFYRESHQNRDEP